MALCPFATRKLLPENRTEPAITATQIVDHSIVGSAAGAYGYFLRSTSLESHFIVTKGGDIWQLIDTDRQADAQLYGNVRAISIETEDNGNPNKDPWTTAQLAALARLHDWIAGVENIPRRRAPSWTKGGLGYHSMWGAPSVWTPSAGKSVALWTQVPTPSGLVEIRDIAVGAEVFDERGQTCRVTGVYDTTPRRAFRVEFDDGLEVIAGDDHQWSVLSPSQVKGWARRDRPRDRHRGPRPERFPDDWATRWAHVSTTEHITDALIPTTQPLDPPTADLSIDPYLLGYWLGDGGERDGVITCHIDDVEWVRERFRAAGYGDGSVQAQRNTHTFRALGFESDLRRLGVLGDKHVPESYLWADVNQRRALLAGLLDSDGHASGGDRCEFTSTRDHLARAVVQLACSLGFRARFSKGVATLNGVEVGPKYRVTWAATTPVFRLPRKAAAHVPGSRLRAQRRRVVGVHQVPTMAMRCLTVDSPSSVFLITDRMVPTHNTCPGTIRIKQWTEILLPAFVTGHAPTLEETMFCKRGDSSDAVGWWQLQLRDLNFYKGEIDEDYGPKMSAAVLAARKAGGSEATSGDVINKWAARQIQRQVTKLDATA